MYDDESSTLWALRGGKRPLIRPKCGFDGLACPVGVWQAYFVYIVSGSVALFIIFAVVIGLIFAIVSKRDTEKRMFCFIARQAVVARRIEKRVELKAEHETEFRYMRKLDHQNLNKFMGICIDGPHLYAVWRYCERSCIADVIENNRHNLDAYIVTSLICDLFEGLFAIHASPVLKQHGSLTSHNCFVSDRWQVKIGDYGMSAWKGVSHRSKRDKKVLYMIRRGGTPPYRPNLSDDIVMVNPALCHLVRDCWNESASGRPCVGTARDALKAIRSNSSKNLMDYSFALLENNASALEHEVEERTQELLQEKRKSDVLLNRMLPRAVADRLKLGQTVEPELFECVVNLLNELYTDLDSIIDQHDVYKVETIGDGLHCISGCPTRNGNEHVRDIAEMAFGFLRAVKAFRVPHLPEHQIQIRIGILTAGMIHISAETKRFIVAHFGERRYRTESRGETLIKGDGVVETFWLMPPEDVGSRYEN